MQQHSGTSRGPLNLLKRLFGPSPAAAPKGSTTAALPRITMPLHAPQPPVEPPVIVRQPVEVPVPVEPADPAQSMFVLFSLPKSAGQIVRMMLDKCRPEGPQWPWEPPSLAAPSGLHIEVPLTDAILPDFPKGGWVHTHAPATLLSLDFLHRRRIRHLVLVRHPLDQLVAYWCHVVKHCRLGMPADLPWAPHLAYTHPHSNVPAVAFHDDCPPDEALGLMIRQGYLESVFDWIGRWSCFRSPQLSRMQTYESLLGDPARFLQESIEFLQPMLALPKEGVGEAVASFETYSQQSLQLNGRLAESAYPRGYTGRIGVHREYLSKQNLDDALAIYRRYCRDSSYGPHLQALYPDL
jgi:hypothetical protein